MWGWTFWGTFRCAPTVNVFPILLLLVLFLVLFVQSSAAAVRWDCREEIGEWLGGAAWSKWRTYTYKSYTKPLEKFVHLSDYVPCRSRWHWAQQLKHLPRRPQERTNGTAFLVAVSKVPTNCSRKATALGLVSERGKTCAPGGTKMCGVGAQSIST